MIIIIRVNFIIKIVTLTFKFLDRRLKLGTRMKYYLSIDITYFNKIACEICKWDASSFYQQCYVSIRILHVSDASQTKLTSTKRDERSVVCTDSRGIFNYISITVTTPILQNRERQATKVASKIKQTFQIQVMRVCIRRSLLKMDMDNENGL